MSIGIGAQAVRIAEDESTVINEYGGYNLNNPAYRNENNLRDGIITIQKDCFAEPDIHQRIKKMPSGKKKLIVKRIPISVDYGKMLNNGSIIVENCSNCWHTTKPGDIVYDGLPFTLPNFFTISDRREDSGISKLSCVIQP